MFPRMSGSEGSKEVSRNLVMLLQRNRWFPVTRELHAFNAPCWGQNVLSI
jgi:hypothetical protein